ncbi:MAG: hypothetical protein OEV44_07060 [Spirochaetota bacterium]|nr:hypothetical protein [Spirochaetota bacterium]
MNKNEKLEKRVSELVEYIGNNLNLESLTAEEQNMVKEEVFKDITDLLLKVGKIIISFSTETNVAIQNRILQEFKVVVGIVNNWTINDLNLLIKLDDNKWHEFSKIIGRIARSFAVHARDISYFSDIVPHKENEELIIDIEKQFEEINHVINTDINKLANNFNEYKSHTDAVVDKFVVKNYDLRKMLNDALYKLTEMRLTFAQMDIIGTNSSEEHLLRKDIERGAKIIANKHGIKTSSQVISDIKGF